MTVMTEPAKKKKRSGKSLGGRPTAEDPRLPIMSFRGRRAFIEWFDRLAVYERIPKANLVERALIEYAKVHGFKEPPPER